MSTTRTADRSRRFGRAPGSVAACLLLSMALGAAEAAPPGSLAEKHPAAVVFRQMARRGGMDFAARHGRLPASLDEIQSGGFTAYLLPPEWQPLFDVHDGRLVINCLGYPAFFAGEPVRGYNVVVDVPGEALYKDVVWPSPVHGAGDRAERQWSFPGAQWLAEGYGWSAVEPMLRRERLSTHLNWLTYEYSRATGSMPGGLGDLEDYLGTARNPAGWQGMAEVATPGEVAGRAGAVFAGWDHGAWVISINIGPTVDTARWVPDERGRYACGRELAY